MRFIIRGRNFLRKEFVFHKSKRQLLFIKMVFFLVIGNETLWEDKCHAKSSINKI